MATFCAPSEYPVGGFLVQRGVCNIAAVMRVHQNLVAPSRPCFNPSKNAPSLFMKKYSVVHIGFQKSVALPDLFFNPKSKSFYSKSAGDDANARFCTCFQTA